MLRRALKRAQEEAAAANESASEARQGVEQRAVLAPLGVPLDASESKV